MLYAMREKMECFFFLNSDAIRMNVGASALLDFAVVCVVYGNAAFSIYMKSVCVFQIVYMALAMGL